MRLHFLWLCAASLLVFLLPTACSAPLPLPLCKTPLDCPSKSCIDGLCLPPSSSDRTTSDADTEILPEIPERRPEPTPERRPEPTPERRPEPQPEPRPEPRPEPQPEPRPDGGCAAHKDCTSGYLCRSGRCSTSCASDSECQKPFQCITTEKICVIPAAEIGPNGRRIWADGSFAPDCMTYRTGLLEPTTNARYWGSAESGIYVIRPSSSKPAFAVYCEMTTQGGGWTLILKADGSRDTFAYDKPLWRDPTQGPGIDPTLHTSTQALLASYSTVPLHQILLSFDYQTTPPSPPSAQIFDLDAPSLADAIQRPGFQPLQRPSSAAWLALGSFPNATSLSRCQISGLSIQTDPGNPSHGFRARLGFFTSTQNDCSGSNLSLIGLGLSFPSSLSIQGTSGTYRSSSSPSPSFATAFLRLFVRKIPSDFVHTENQISVFSNGLPPPDCLHLPFRSSSPLPSQRSFLLHPPASPRPFPALCQNLLHGGWTLVLKANGRQSNFAYDKPLWNEPDPTKRHFQPDRHAFDANETLLPSYSTLPLRQALVQMVGLPTPAPPDLGKLQTLIVPLTARSLAAAILASSGTQAEPSPPNPDAWKDLLSTDALLTGCTRQGAGIVAGSDRDLLSTLRFGILGDGNSSCDDPNSFLGFGPQTSSSGIPSVGTAYRGSNPSKTEPAFGLLSIRDLAATSETSTSAEIRSESGVRQRRNTRLESSCRSYRYPPLFQGTAAQSGIYRLLPPDSLDRSDSYEAYCDMDTDGGGWTLAMKIDGNLPDFRFSSGEWTSNSTFPSSNPDPKPNHVQAKLRSFSSIPFTELLLFFHARSSATPDITKASSIRLALRSTSLLDLFKKPSFQPFERGAGRLAWEALLPPHSLQSASSLEGVHLPLYTDAPAVRLGIAANNETHFESNDSALGIGVGDLSAGFRLDWDLSLPTPIRIPAFVWVFVR